MVLCLRAITKVDESKSRRDYEDEDDDLVGADSNHTCHSGDSLDEKLMDVLGYIEEIIINYQKAVDKYYWEGCIIEGTNN